MKTSVFIEKTCKSRFFALEKNRFVRKIQVLTPKTKFSRGKENFTSEIVFFSGNLSFSIEKLVEIPFFSLRKNRLVRKIQVLTPKTRFFGGKENFTSEIVF